MTTPIDPLDEIAVPAKTYRQVFAEMLTDDWNLRRQVMHASDHDVFHATYTMRANCPMSLAKRVLPELPPME